MQKNELVRIIEQAARGRVSVLNLGHRAIETLPVELGNIKAVEMLGLSNNTLTSLPPEIGQLANLRQLELSYNQLMTVPAEFGELADLRTVYLGSNQLTSLPAEFGRLTNLKYLDLSRNQLISIPPELGQLVNLIYLDLSHNQLRSIPPELGNLNKLSQLRLLGNEAMRSPPPEVVRQGTKAILAYLRESLKRSEKQWISKLLLVGEGGVGKTQLLRALQGKEFQIESETTHGIGVEDLFLPHPDEDGVEMKLSCWDFGGQQIYHATHQFFLTQRSLFVLVWDARQGWEAGKLYKWLDTIHSLAPGAPVLVVAAKIDERDADLPLDDLSRRYENIIGHYEVSNRTRDGVESLRKAIVNVAASLPLMGEEWPADWVEAADAIRKRRVHYISPGELMETMKEHGIFEKNEEILCQWLHDLGDILYFRENEELNDVVILDPMWVIEKVSRVLESKKVVGKEGIFTREHMDELWADVENENIRQHLLRLMEQFDLSYRTLENREISLVVERLPLDPPEYKASWNAILKTQGCKEISMKFAVGSLQAGLPTWFIARSHRFTTHTHWRMGALFADNREERRHLGLVEAYEYDRYIRLTVRGPVPYNFFALLRDGLELTLARFPGLRIKRTVPCPGHDEKNCTHEFDLEQLEKAFRENVMWVPCPETSYKNKVSVVKMLFGLHAERHDEVLERIDEMEAKLGADHEAIRVETSELKTLAQRGYTSLFSAEQRLAESHCPNVFTVVPKKGHRWLKHLVGQKMVLQLYCQAPGQWHPAVEGAKGGRYEIKRPGEFLGNMGPYILKLAKVIKYAAPMAGAAAGMAAAGSGGAVIGAATAKKLAAQIKLMVELAKKLADRDYLEAELLERTGGGTEVEQFEGAELRALRILLDELDPKQEWGGLKKVLTPEGHYLWLCEYHVAEYKE